MDKRATAAAPSGWTRLAVDLSPLLVFFAVNAWRGIFSATAAFMVAIVAAILFSVLKFSKVSPMLWFTAVLVLVMGSITIWLHNETFIKIKPTIYYCFVASLLVFGMATRRNLLKSLLGSTYEGLSERGWFLFSRNWAVYFVIMAILNELVWRTTSTDFWVAFKLWFFLPSIFVFTMLNMPMLMRHGLQLEDAKEEPPVPPSQ